MAYLLSTLVARLTDGVPVYNSVPSADQYEQAVKDAVDAYSLRNPIVATETLELEADTADYDLPGDFIEAIRMRAPASGDYKDERWEIKGDGTITFSPTPSTDHDYEMRYCAKHVGTASGGDTSYPDLTDTDARVLLFLAKTHCLQHQADKAARDAWQYSEGEQSVNKQNQAAMFQKMAQQAQADYERELKRVPTHGRVGLTEMAQSGD